MDWLVESFSRGLASEASPALIRSCDSVIDTPFVPAGFVFPFILNALLNRVGLAWTLRIWAIVGALCSGIALLGVKARLPVPKYNAINRRPRLIPNDLGFLRTPLFLTFASFPCDDR